MAVNTPTMDALARIVDRLPLSLTREDLASFRGLMGNALASYARLDELPEPTLPVTYPRRPGFRPQPADNPLGGVVNLLKIMQRPGREIGGQTLHGFYAARAGVVTSRQIWNRFRSS